MMYVFYNILLHLLAILASPVLLFAALLNTFTLRQRLGFWKFSRDTARTEIVWFHAASMGEVTALATIVYDITRALPNLGVVVSTSTLTGRNRAKDLIPQAEGVFLRDGSGNR